MLQGYICYHRPEAFRAGVRTLVDAGRYREWFLGELPARLQVLGRAVRENGGAAISLDLSPASLAPLGGWYDGRVVLRDHDGIAPAAEPDLIPAWAARTFAGRTLTPESLSLAVDIGLYLAEVLRRRHEALRWETVRRAQPGPDRYMMALLPFGEVHMNPLRLGADTAFRAVSGASACRRLPELFAVWSGLHRAGPGAGQGAALAPGEGSDYRNRGGAGAKKAPEPPDRGW